MKNSHNPNGTWIVRQTLTLEDLELSPVVPQAATALEMQQRVWDMLDLRRADRIALTLIHFAGFSPPFNRTYSDGTTGTWNTAKHKWQVS